MHASIRKQRLLKAALCLALALLLPPGAAAADGAAAGKAAGTISFLENPTKVYDGTAVTDPSVQTNSGGAVRYVYYDASGSPLDGAPAGAGSYAVAASVAATANYAAATTDPRAFTIEKRSVALGLSVSQASGTATITAAVLGMIAPEGSLSFSFTGPAGDQTESVPISSDGDGRCAAAAVYAYGSVSTGTYTVTVSFAGSADYSAARASQSYDAAQETRSISGVEPSYAKSYGDAAFTLTPSASPAGRADTFSYEIVYDQYPSLEGAVTVDSSGRVSTQNAGTSVIRVTLKDGNGHYAEAVTYADVHVAPAALTVTSQVKKGGETIATAAYGTAGDLTYTLAYDGFQNGDTVSTFTKNSSTLTAVPLTDTADAGEHAVGIARCGSDSLTLNGKAYSGVFLCRNYALTCVPASLTITRVKPDAAVKDQIAKIGWGLQELAVPSAAGVNGETVPGTFSWSESRGGAALGSSYVFSGTAGAQKTLYWTFAPADETNYTPAAGSAVFTLEAKTQVTISGLSAPEKRTYTGSAVQNGEFGTPAFSAADYSDGLTYAYYAGSAASGGTIPAPSAIGSYTLRASIPASSRDYTGYTDVPFSIVKGTGVLSSAAFTPSASQTVGSGFSFSAALTDTGGNPIAGAEVDLAFTGSGYSKTWSFKTNADGTVKSEGGPEGAFKEIPVGTYAVALRYAGDSCYNGAAWTASYTIAPVPSDDSGDTDDASRTVTDTKTNADGSVTRTETSARTDSTGAVTRTETRTTTAADGTTTKTETIQIAGGTCGLTAEASMETSKNGKAIATALIKAPAATALLPAAVVQAAISADTARVTVQIGEVTVILDKAAMEAVRAAGGETPSLSAVPVAAKELPAQLQNAAKAYDLKVSGRSVDFGSGSAVVRIPYAKADSSKAAAVFRIKADSTIERIYGAALAHGQLNIPTAGWSVYAVVEAEPLAFADVKDSDWFYGGVAYALDRHLFQGISAAAFSPLSAMTRQQVWMVLARMAGANPANMAEARQWAIAQNISDGSAPAAAITREQFVTLLWRAAGSPKVSADLSGYTDSAAVSAYAKDAMAWAAASGVITGTAAAALSPSCGATRAQIAVILMRYSQSAAK